MECEHGRASFYGFQNLLEDTASGDINPGAIKRCRSGYVEGLEIAIAPCEIRGYFRHLDNSQAGGIGREDEDAAGAGAVDVVFAVDW